MLRRNWLTLVTCAALLVVPLLGLLLFPSTPRATTTPRPAASAEAPSDTDTAIDTEPAPERPRRRPAFPTPAQPDDDEEPQPAPEAAAEPIRGLVVDATGQPVAGALVRCTDRELRPSSSDGEGHVELLDDADGCSATAQHPGHSVSAAVTIRAGAENRFVMGRAGGIAGVVVDESGKPVPSYVIAIESFVAPAGDGPGPGRGGAPRGIEDASGNFEWPDLPAGRYVLTASTDGRPPARSESIQVDAGIVTRNVRLILAGGATFRGKVVDADTRKPVAGATFTLDTATTTGANAIGSVESDAAGAFALDGVPARGLFSVRVTHPEYRTKILSGLDVRGTKTLTETVPLSPRGDGGGDSELAGIGAYLVPGGSGGVVVAGLVPGGPAEKGGLRRGDKVMRIDGDDASGMPLAEAVQRLRGPEGSRLAVRVEREGQALELNIVRAIVVR